jgi:hypothetical protein
VVQASSDNSAVHHRASQSTWQGHSFYLSLYNRVSGSLAASMDEANHSGPNSTESSGRLGNHGMRLKRGILIPGQMLSPGQDGYRTPTIEDYEEHHQQNSHRSNHTSALNGAVNFMHITLNSGTRTHFSLSKGLEKLAWRQRLRHFTWTFFTMTMATGGIANVIHAGRFSLQRVSIMC